MYTGRGDHRYEWIDRWAHSPDSESARTGWAHHDVVVSETGSIITFHQADPTVLSFDADGNLERSWKAPVANAHGMAIVKEDGAELLWLADNTTGRVVKTDLDGNSIMEVMKPDLPVYAKDATYAPTSVVVNEVRNGGNGDVWVADGYGQSYVHRYDKTGMYLGSINGEEGDAGAFDCPHGIWIDTRKAEAELYVADRANGQVQVYDTEGGFRRAFGTGAGKDWLHSPSGFASHGEFMLVSELRGSRITILDADDELVGYLGENSGAFKRLADWPNVSHDDVEPGLFNSPHGVAAADDGSIYVAEWMIGGRITKLAKMPQYPQDH